jgi:hypothetical protein
VTYLAENCSTIDLQPLTTEEDNVLWSTCYDGSSQDCIVNPVVAKNRHDVACLWDPQPGTHVCNTRATTRTNRSSLLGGPIKKPQYHEMNPSLQLLSFRWRLVPTEKGSSGSPVQKGWIIFPASISRAYENDNNSENINKYSYISPTGNSKESLIISYISFRTHAGSIYVVHYTHLHHKIDTIK